MGKSEPQLIGEVLKGIVEELGRSKKDDTARVSSSWRSLAGKELARHTKLVQLKRGILLVNAQDSAWLYQASLNKEKLLRGLQKKLGKQRKVFLA